MSILNFFKKAEKAPISDLSLKSMSFTDFLKAGGNQDLSASIALKYYSRVSAVSDAVDKICEPFSTLPVAVKNIETKESILNHPLLSLLKKPNPEQTQTEFMLSIATNLKVAGYVGVYVTTSMRGEPLEMWVVPPHYIQTENQGKITVDGEQLKDVFSKKEIDGLYRYFSETDENRELYIFKEFDTKTASSGSYGMSKLNPVYSEIEQFDNSNKHNLSLLERGARPSGILMVDGDLTEQQYNRLRKQFEEYYAGSQNSGRVLLGEQIKDFKALSQTNKDMDFGELKKGVKESIYNAMNIPLALISAANMTLDNLKIAQLQLYDQAVLPLACKIYEDLTRFIMYRYKGSENLELDYIESEIEALAPRRLSNVRFLKDMNVATDNEIRRMLGLSDYDGGDTHYVASNLIPVGVADDGVKAHYTELLENSGKYTSEEIKALTVELNGEY